MAIRKIKDPVEEFEVTVVYPTEENKAEYDKRVAKAMARILIESLPPEKIDELLDEYKKLK